MQHPADPRPVGAPHAADSLPKPQREPVEVQAPERPDFGFDVAKLESILEQRHRAGLAQVDLSDRWRDARALLQKLRGMRVHDESTYGRTTPEIVERIERAEGEERRLKVELDALVAANESLIAVANNCEAYARSKGWRPANQPPGSPALPPLVKEGV